MSEEKFIDIQVRLPKEAITKLDLLAKMSGGIVTSEQVFQVVSMLALHGGGWFNEPREPKKDEPKVPEQDEESGL